MASSNQHPQERNFVVVGSVLALIGVAIAVYSTVHFLQVKIHGATDYACNINNFFSCDDVARSNYAEIFGIPLGAWGVSYFLANFCLLVFGQALPKNRVPSLQAYTFMVLIGLAASIFLGFISFFSIGAFCISCVGIYVVCLVQGLVLMGFREVIPLPFERKNVMDGGLVAASVVAVSILLYSFFVKQNINLQQAQLRSPQQANQENLLAEEPSNIPVHTSPYSGEGEDFRKGPDSARVKIAVFSDFQCPACKQVDAYILKPLKQRFGDQIQIVYKNFPLDPSCNKEVRSNIHPQACAAALLARCAGQKDPNLFWRAHDLIFQNQQGLNTQTLQKIAKDVGLEEAEYKECRSESGFQKMIMDKIQSDIAVAAQANVQATPTLFINGYRFIGQTNENVLAALIQSML